MEELRIPHLHFNSNKVVSSSFLLMTFITLIYAYDNFENIAYYFDEEILGGELKYNITVDSRCKYFIKISYEKS